MPITTQPSAGKPAGSSGEFNNSLFGCACGSCIKALCCPCLIAKDVANEVGDSGTLWCLGYLAGIFTGYLVSPLKSSFPSKQYDFYQNWPYFSQCIYAYATNAVYFVKTAVSMVDAALTSFCPIFAHAAFWLRWTEKSTSKTIKIVNCSQALAHNSYSSPVKLTHSLWQLQYWVEIHCENLH